MILNRTLEYKKYLRRRDVDFSPLTTTDIRASLRSIRESISALCIKQEKHCLPSFASKRKIQDEIEALKHAISDEVSQAEERIAGIAHASPCSMLNATMHAYFVGQLKTVIYSFRSLQQEFLKKIDFYEDADHCEEENGENTMLLENVKDVRKSIYNLTTVLLDMKMAVGQQSAQIDRLDFYFETINMHLEGTNKELEKLPVSYRGTKNKVMYFLLSLSMLLATISVMKAFRRG